MRSSTTNRIDEQIGDKEISGRILSDIQRLAPEIRQRSAEMESTGRIPMDLIESLKSIGVFRMFVPRSHGGLALNFIDGMKVVQALSRIDGSIGWTARVSNGNGIFASHQRPEDYDKMYENGPDLIFAGSIKPKGKAESAVNGWRLDGRWRFASACQHADWIYGAFVVHKNGVPVMQSDGQTVVRYCFLPARLWEIHKTCPATGLKATGSHDIEIKNGFAPEENLFDLFDPEFRRSGSLYRNSFPLILLLVPAVLIGIAEGALDELVRLASTGCHQAFAVTALRDSEWFQGQLGRIEADLNAARAYLQVRAAEHWHHALSGSLKMDPFVTQTTQTSTWVGTTCVRITQECFALAGGAAANAVSPLQRRLHDLLVAAQHAFSQKRQYAAAGKLLLADASHPGFSDALV
jgi:indole-3-acetate monooxygenase